MGKFRDAWEDLKFNVEYSDIGLKVSDMADTCKELPRKSSEALARTRNVIDDKVTELNPTLGKVVNATMNIPSTVMNGVKGVFVPHLCNKALYTFSFSSTHADFICDEEGNVYKPILPESYIDVSHLEEGDHIFCHRSVYSHHGIYIGDYDVVHYDGKEICRVNIEEFLDGARLCKANNVISPMLYDGEEVAFRALGSIGEEKYNVGINNCEHFARWCRSGGDELTKIFRS